ncbi:MAG: signal protein PDZ [Acidimicrobiales bacterium]|nr:MAG: signal protein PDZ [Acidimicrobiales bacterium]
MPPLLLFGSVLVAAALVRVDRHALSPGALRLATELVEIRDVPVYRDHGDIGFLTVDVHRLSVLEEAVARLSPDVEIVDSEVILGGLTPEQNRRVNLEAMQMSQQVAAAVALRVLGHDVVRDAGVFVAEVDPDGPTAGRLKPGETIVNVGRRTIRRWEELVDEIARRQPGDVVTLTVGDTSGKRRTVRVKLAARPDEPSRGFLGIAGQTLPDIDLPFELNVSSGNIGGPSGGLAFTLAMIDMLTPGDLTGGHKIAATGVIRLDGSVGEVGGVREKSIVARQSGADVLLVPKSEVGEVPRKWSPEHVHGVSDVKEALALLAELGGDPVPNVEED